MIERYPSDSNKMYGFHKVIKIGLNLIINGDFSAWTGDNPDDWIVIEAGDATSNITETNAAGNPTLGGGFCTLISDGTNTLISQTVLTVGQLYKLNFDISTVTIGAIKISDGSVFIASNINTIGTKEYYFIANGTTLIISRSGACNVTLNNISVVSVTLPKKTIL